MNVYTIHFYKSGDIQSRALKIADKNLIAGLSQNSLIIASDLSEKEIIEKLAEPVFIFNQFSDGWRGPKEVSLQLNDKICHILNSGPPTPRAVEL
jgi:hypothetical protein